jgi:putative zinc finger protein
MQCREVRELLDAFLGDQLLVETTNDVVRHLEVCPACRAELEGRRALRARLQSAFGSAVALAPRPEFLSGLETRLRTEATSRMTRRSWLRSWGTAAAAIVTAISGGLFARSAAHRSRLATLARNAAGDHQNCAIKFNLAERPISLEEAARRYDPAFASFTTLSAPTGLPNGTAEILDRHSCVYEGRRFAHVVFRYGGHIVSLLVTGGTESIGSSPEMLPTDGALKVASFSAGRHLVFVVSDLSAQDTSRFAQAMVGPLAQRLTNA